MKSALQIARAAYKPRMPLILNQNVKTVDGQATESVSDRESIKALFPNTYGMPVVTFEADNDHTEHRQMNVGVILSGG